MIANVKIVPCSSNVLKIRPMQDWLLVNSS